MLWDQWQVHNGKKPTFLPSTKPAATRTAPALQVAAPGALPAATSTPTAFPPRPATPLPAQPPCPVRTTAVPAAGEKIVVTTDVLKLTFDTEGGSLVRTEFIKHAV